MCAFLSTLGFHFFDQEIRSFKYSILDSTLGASYYSNK